VNVYLLCHCRVRLKSDSKDLDASATNLQLAKMQERKNALQRKIKAWTTIQHLYIPEVAALRVHEDREVSNDAPEIAPYDLPLHLPSSLPARIPCTLKLRQYEFRLREAQAHESLEELRHHLRLRTHMYKYKDKNITGQRANTRSQSSINRVQKKVDASAARYTAARHALTKLSRHVEGGEWSTRLLPLAQEDIRPLMIGEEGQSEGRRTLSWIWKVVGVSDQSQNEDMQEGRRKYHV